MKFISFITAISAILFSSCAEDQNPNIVFHDIPQSSYTPIVRSSSSSLEQTYHYQSSSSIFPYATFSSSSSSYIDYDLCENQPEFKSCLKVYYNNHTRIPDTDKKAINARTSCSKELHCDLTL